jgi:hypothetical protein
MMRAGWISLGVAALAVRVACAAPASAPTFTQPAPGKAVSLDLEPATLADLRVGGAIKVSWEAPGIPALARNFHRQGLPILPLWQNSRSLVALGLDSKGVLGLYLRPRS